jgi:ABC-type Zn uptake system ZnuABC Zn-binding protein ZnuA
VLSLAGCGVGSASSHGRVRVVATTTQLGDFVRQVGGADVDLHQILQPNSDPHEYEPRPRDVAASAGAKVIFESGDGLDRWMAKVVDGAGGSPAVVTIAPAHTPDRLPGEAGADASGLDPHWWHDPRNAESAVAAIERALAAADRAHARAYERRAHTYLARLRILDAGIAACMRAVPVAARKLVTSHDAFGYFARRYGIAVIGAVIPSQSTQAQPSAGDVQRLATLIRREHVSAIYPESSINPKLADALARETGASAGYQLYGDTLGPSGSRGASYIGMELANADAMVRGFTGGARGCRVPGLAGS